MYISKIYFQYQDHLNFVDVTIFSQMSAFFSKNSTFTQSNRKTAVLEFSISVKQKAVINENARITDQAIGIRLLDYSKSAINQKKNNDVITCPHDLIVSFFNVSCLSFQTQLLMQVSCQYRYCFQSYDTFCLEVIDSKFGNHKYPRLSFIQYLKIGASQGYKIWEECFKTQGLQFLPFLSYQRKILPPRSNLMMVRATTLYNFLLSSQLLLENV